MATDISGKFFVGSNGQPVGLGTIDTGRGAWNYQGVVAPAVVSAPDGYSISEARVGVGHGNGPNRHSSIVAHQMNCASAYQEDVDYWVTVFRTEAPVNDMANRRPQDAIELIWDVYVKSSLFDVRGHCLNTLRGLFFEPNFSAPEIRHFIVGALNVAVDDGFKKKRFEPLAQKSVEIMLELFGKEDSSTLRILEILNDVVGKKRLPGVDIKGRVLMNLHNWVDKSTAKFFIGSVEEDDKLRLKIFEEVDELLGRDKPADVGALLGRPEEIKKMVERTCGSYSLLFAATNALTYPPRFSLTDGQIASSFSDLFRSFVPELCDFGLFLLRRIAVLNNSRIFVSDSSRLYGPITELLNGASGNGMEESGSPLYNDAIVRAIRGSLDRALETNNLQEMAHAAMLYKKIMGNDVPPEVDLADLLLNRDRGDPDAARAIANIIKLEEVVGRDGGAQHVAGLLEENAGLREKLERMQISEREAEETQNRMVAAYAERIRQLKEENEGFNAQLQLQGSYLVAKINELQREIEQLEQDKNSLTFSKERLAERVTQLQQRVTELEDELAQLRLSQSQTGNSEYSLTLNFAEPSRLQRRERFEKLMKKLQKVLGELFHSDNALRVGASPQELERQLKKINATLLKLGIQ